MCRWRAGMRYQRQQTLRPDLRIAQALRMSGRPPTGFGHYLRDVVYGALDGVITTLAVIAGAAGAHLEPRVGIILGLANLVADGLSMGASNYLGLKSELEQANHSVAAEAPWRHGLATAAAFATVGAVPLAGYVVAPLVGVAGAAGGRRAGGRRAAGRGHRAGAVRAQARLGQRRRDAADRGRGDRRSLCRRGGGRGLAALTAGRNPTVGTSSALSHQQFAQLLDPQHHAAHQADQQELLPADRHGVEDAVQRGDVDDRRLQQVAEDAARRAARGCCSRPRLSADRRSERQLSTLNHSQTASSVKVSDCDHGQRHTGAGPRRRTSPSVQATIAGIISAMRASSARVSSGSPGRDRAGGASRRPRAAPSPG